MGTLKEHAIIVTGYYGDHIEEAHAIAEEIFDVGRFFPFADAEATLVSPIIDSMVNSVRTFFVAPDGSKEGWSTSDTGDACREEFIKWLRKQRYDDGSSPLQWVEVQYGDEAHRTARALRSQDKDYKRVRG